MADATAASLATALLGLNRKRDPLDIYNSFAKQQLAAGSSTAPLGSGNPLEGVARALQGGLGGLTAGIMAGREEAKGKDTVSFLADLLNSKDNTELAAKAQNFKGDPEVLAPILSQLLGNRQQQFQRDAAGNAFVAGYGGAPASGQQATPQPPSGVPPPLSTAAVPGGGFANNTGNIRSTAPGNVNGFATYATPQEGANAHFANYQAYVKQNPNITVAQALAKWSPPNENNTNSIISQLSEATGINPGMPLAEVLQDPAMAAQLLDAQTRLEKGGLPQGVTADTFMAATGGRPAPAGPMGPGQIASPPAQLAQGDALPPGAPSATSEPPVIPKPQPTQEQIQRHRSLIASGESPAAADAKLQAELQHQWDKDQTRATQIWQDQQTSKRQNEKSAIDLGQKAPMEMITKRVDNYENKIRPAALAAVSTIDNIHQVRQVLDAGAFTGTGAGAKQFLAKIGEQFGIPSDAGVNTQVLGSVLAKQVLAGSGGTLGTGFSNADRDFMENAQGAKITIDEAALRRIADIGERQARMTLKNHDTEAARVKKLPGIAQLGDDQFGVPAVPTYQEWAKANPLPQVQGGPQAPAGPAPPTASAAPSAGPSQVQEGATATNPQTGQKIVFRGGQWVPVQ